MNTECGKLRLRIDDDHAGSAAAGRSPPPRTIFTSILTINTYHFFLLWIAILFSHENIFYYNILFIYLILCIHLILY